MLRKLNIIIVSVVLIFISCKTQKCLDKYEGKHLSLKEEKSSSFYDSIIQPFREIIGNKMQLELVECTNSLTKDGDETTLGNFVCDAVKWATDSLKGKTLDAFVLMNRGGLRSNINKGMVTVNSIFELMPFDNEIEILEIDGKELLEIMNAVVDKKHAFLGGIIKAEKLKILDVKVSGNKVNLNKKYTLITSDYLALGGDNFKFGAYAFSSEKTNFKIRDAIINYCLHLKFIGKKIEPYVDGRLEIIK